MSRRLSLRRRTRGYTVVEVLATMTLFAIGAAGVISMQRVTIQGGDDARRFDVATNIANEWTSRLQRDAMFWTLPDADNTTSSNYASATKWLGFIDTAETTWHTPAVPTSTGNADSPAFDLLGRELTGTSGHMFCAQYRLTWAAKPPVGSSGSTPPWPLGVFMRAEVRVIFNRLETNIIDNCAGLADGAEPDPTKYHFVYVTTALRSNPAK